MRVSYRANNEIRDVSDEAGFALVTAGICDVVDPPKKEPKKPEKPDKPTKVEPLTTEDMPTPPKRAA